MYTQCPECDTIFRVTATVLRAAQGQVRCGVCDATFDAVRYLMDEIDSGVNAASASQIILEPDPPAPPTPTHAEPPPSPAPYLPSTALPLVAFDVTEAANEWWATPVTTDLPEYLFAPSADLETFDLTDTDLTLSSAPADRSQPDDYGIADIPLSAETPEIEAGNLGLIVGDEPISACDETSEVQSVLDESDRQIHPPQQRSRRRHRAASITMAAVLALLLVGQWIDHERGRLATIPALASGLTAIYSWTGRSIEPAWELSAYDLRDWHAETESSSETVHLRARILNRGDRTQPWPLLRVTFEDRYGGTVARRDFLPTEYLPDHPVTPGAFAPGTVAEADLILSDPGHSVAGFELDTCLPKGATIGCGSDTKGTRAE
jgi:predicted Zn finger-like uncharacterized protein